jgi:hypothetical protein
MSALGPTSLQSRICRVASWQMAISNMIISSSRSERLMPMLSVGACRQQGLGEPPPPACQYG